MRRYLQGDEIVLPDKLHVCKGCTKRVETRIVRVAGGHQGVTACDCGVYSVDTPVFGAIGAVTQAFNIQRRGDKPARPHRVPRKNKPRTESVEEYKARAKRRPTEWAAAHA